jgi:Arc/MetJ-type ribon-helix-helix transcriptional regulator
MTTQITVRLPDENVAWLDAEVSAGRFPSRTAGLAKLLTKAQRRQEDEADMLKILASPDPDEASRLEWMRTREYPPIDDHLSYPDEQHAVSIPDLVATGAVQDRASSGTTRESGRTTSEPKVSATTRTRRTAADSGKTNRTTISK